MNTVCASLNATNHHHGMKGPSDVVRQNASRSYRSMNLCPKLSECVMDQAKYPKCHLHQQSLQEECSSGFSMYARVKKMEEQMRKRESNLLVDTSCRMSSCIGSSQFVCCLESHCPAILTGSQREEWAIRQHLLIKVLLRGMVRGPRYPSLTWSDSCGRASGLHQGDSERSRNS